MIAAVRAWVQSWPAVVAGMVVLAATAVNVAGVAGLLGLAGPMHTGLVVAATVAAVAVGDREWTRLRADYRRWCVEQDRGGAS